MADMWQPFAEGIWSLASLAQNAQAMLPENSGIAYCAFEMKLCAAYL